MIYSGYPPGSFNDARDFGWRSIPKLVAQWWPMYAFGILAVLAARLAKLPPLADEAIVLLLVTTPGFVTCATQFRGRFALTPSLLGGITLTYILPSIGEQLAFRSTLLAPRSALIVALLVALIAILWLSPKLYGAGCFYLLGSGKLTPSECFALAWRFIAGNIWVDQFSVGLVGGLTYIPVAIVVILIRRANLEPIASTISIAGGLLLNLYYSSALMRIVSTSHELFKTYWEASENSAQ